MLGMLPKKQSSKRRKKSKFARLDVWAHAQIVILAKEGVKPQSIRRKVRKKDGTMPTPRAVRDTIPCLRKVHKYAALAFPADHRWKMVEKHLREVPGSKVTMVKTHTTECIGMLTSPCCSRPGYRLVAG